MNVLEQSDLDTFELLGRSADKVHRDLKNTFKVAVPSTNNSS